ncbi:MAG: MCE family protein [Verrucomicrobia bacterium]|nr:MCE family protein [Cytophagales bacterium]
MKPQKNNRPVIVGIFVLVGLAILVAAIFTLGGQKKTFVRSLTVSAIFDDVGGLSVGANIWFSGLKVGTVKKIEFYGDSQVQVTMYIDEVAAAHIHKDAKAKIGSDGVIGNKIVVIYENNLAKPLIASNDFLQVEKSFSTEDMLATLQVNNKNLLAITSDLKSISKKIDSGEGTLATLLNDPSMALKLNETVNDLQATAKNFKNLSSESKSVMGNIQNFSAKINKPGNSIHDVASDTVLYHTIVGTVTQLQNAAGSLNKFTADLKTVSEKMKQENNSIGVLLNDTASAASLKNTIKNLETGSYKLNEDLEAVQHNFLLKGYFRKKEKAKKK